uniref:Thiol:disulfide interchange protein DsbD N-terminal domain-containing protein n=1 Tax=Streptomyces sp. NBC_00049 TaxID=2903617 RepID=A0AAU2K0S5_9ACTN
MNVHPHVRHSRKTRIAVALLSTAALAACGGQPAESAAAPPTTSFTENGVTVTLSVSDWHAAKGTLTATFTPEEKGFHLYSTDLPPTGIEGVGRPTAVDVGGVLKTDGKLTAGAEVRTISVPGVDAPVPVYPDGPVTTTLPVRADGNGDATVLLGYASCSTEEGCTIPVSDRPVRLRVTEDGPTFAPH